MAKEKKLVQAITSMDEDFAQWYTDVVKKAELCGYTSVKGCMAIKLALQYITICCLLYLFRLGISFLLCKLA